MSVFQDEGRRKAIIFAFIMIVVGIIVYSFITAGARGIKAVFFKFITVTIIFGILFFIGWAIWWIFQERKIDLYGVSRDNIVQAATMGRNPLLHDLYVVGDKEHSEFRLGKILGYCQIQNPKGLRRQIIEREDNPELSDEEAKQGFIVTKEDCFLFKRGMWFTRPFEKPKILRVLPTEHSELVGDIKVYAVSVVYRFGYFFPNTADLDVERIDYAVAQDALRGMTKVVVDDVVTITKKAMGADQEHEKTLEYRKLLKIPRPLGDEEERR